MSTDLSGASSSRSSQQQLGRHAGAHSMSSARVDSHAGGAGGASASQQGHTPRQRKTLAPSSAQKAKNQSMPASAPPARRPTAKDYVASRVWKNESTLTFGMRVKLAEQPFLWADAQFAATNIVDIWTHYAGERDTLDRGAVTQLAADLVDRFVALYREQLLREQPGLAESDLQRAVKKDVWPHLLPGDNMVECKRIMAEKLTRELDVDHDGQITKTEFFFQVRRKQSRADDTTGANDRRTSYMHTAHSLPSFLSFLCAVEEHSEALFGDEAATRWTRLCHPLRHCRRRSRRPLRLHIRCPSPHCSTIALRHCSSSDHSLRTTSPRNQTVHVQLRRSIAHRPRFGALFHSRLTFPSLRRSLRTFFFVH